ncbi:hypothetical protein ACKF11_08395 [Methylobacillus sp. Pita2]|uniref:hypothetical protein n=1 Tax=Methylobacillus sp. Pita2 TaxID=3383245 RepID=UPI0038B5A791
MLLKFIGLEKSRTVTREQTVAMASKNTVKVLLQKQGLLVEMKQQRKISAAV